MTTCHLNCQLDQLHVIFMETEYQNRTRTCGTVTSLRVARCVTFFLHDAFAGTSTSHGHIVRPEKIGRELHHLTERVMVAEIYN